MNDALLELLALGAVLLLVMAWRRVAGGVHADQAHRLLALGLFVAAIATAADRSVVSQGAIGTGLVLGIVAAVWLARLVTEFRLPQFLVLANGLGGGGALFVAGLEYARVVHTGAPTPIRLMLAIQLVLLLGGLTLGASAVLWGRLESRIPKAPLAYRFQRSISGAGAGLMVLLMLYLTKSPDHPWWLSLAATIAVVIGVLGALRLPDADMPLTIAWLVAATALSAALSGLILDHDGLTAAGGFVGAAATTMAVSLAREQQRPLHRMVERALWGAAKRSF